MYHSNHTLNYCIARVTQEYASSLRLRNKTTTMDRLVVVEFTTGAVNVNYLHMLHTYTVVYVYRSVCGVCI